MIHEKARNHRRAVARRARWLAAALAVGAALPVTAQQPGGAPQAGAPAAVQDLNTALDDLTRSPNDVSALLRAGWASLGLGDTRAALGFFRRAEQASPTNGEAKAGEASAMLRMDDPVAAVSLFAAAEAAGAPMARYGSDRGLALDLVGENVAAQRFYRQALALNNDPETVRRLALSQAISGDERGAEATLLPLLQRQDLSAYRTRAFALAILGKGEEAVSIAEKLLPANLSNRMAPYLRYMPRLTRAQQAAAANLGEFPPASEIGRDSPQIAALSAQNPVQVVEGGPDSRLVPAGQPLGRASGDRRQQREDKSRKKDKKKRDEGSVSVTYTPLPQVKVASAQPAPPPVQAAARQAPAPTPAPTPTPPPRATPAPSPVQQAAAPQAPADQPPAPASTTPKPVLVASLDQPASSPPEASAEDAKPSLSISPPARAPAAAKPVSLADAFADFAKEKPSPGRPAPGAVDITKLEPPREAAKPAPKPAPKAKPKPPADPSRVWVQVGTGRDVKALAFTWRRLQKEAGALLAKHDGYSAKWGATRRLVTGPYKSEDDAQDAVKALKKKGIDAFEFTSDEGEAVTPLK
jgi:Flp pilus assembly protein TadD